MGIQDPGICPKCGMELLEFTYQSVRIEQCSGCEGLWLDRGELEAIERMPKGSLFSLEFEAKWALAKELQGRTSPEEREERRRQAHLRCPRCGAPLQEVLEHGTQMDRCAQCGGVWLDAGEFDQVAGAERPMARLRRFLQGK